MPATGTTSASWPPTPSPPRTASRPGAPSSTARSPRAGSASEKVLLLKPGTYMNLSGDAVRAALGFYKLEPADVIVLHDELDLAAGKVRVKRGGGTAGHNGIRSIDAHIGPDFTRVRLGIGHPGDKRLVTGHVLGDFAKSDAEWLDPLLRGRRRGAPGARRGRHRRLPRRGRPAHRAAEARRRRARAGRPGRPGRPRRPRTAAARCRSWSTGSGERAAVRAAFAEQGRICTAMGSPFTGAALRPRSPSGWRPAARSPTGCSAGPASLPTAATPAAAAGRRAARAGARRRATRAWPPSTRPTSRRRRRALGRDRRRRWSPMPTSILRRLDGPPQTNEPQRSAALCPGFLTVAARTGLPLVTSELGASAGLNLRVGPLRLPLRRRAPGATPARRCGSSPTGRARRRRCPPARVAERAGCDRDAGGRHRRARPPAAPLLRLGRPDRAQGADGRGDRDRPACTASAVERADAADWLDAPPRRCRAPAAPTWSITRSSGPTCRRRRRRALRASLDAAGARATAAAPLAWLRMEGDGAGARARRSP